MVPRMPRPNPMWKAVLSSTSLWRHIPANKSHTASQTMTAMVVYPRDAAWVPTSVRITIGTVLTAIAVVLGVLGALYLGRGLTPSPLPTASAKLVTKGPYRFVRHPIHTAVMILGVGISLRSGTIMVTVAFIGLIILFNLKARWEETRLVMSFPGYESYMETTDRFLPKAKR